MALIFFHLLAAFCLAATLLPLSRSEAWWVRAGDFPRLQVAVLAAVALLGIWLTGGFRGQVFNLLTGALLIAAIGYQLALILPYTPLWPVELKTSDRPPGPTTAKLMVTNVLMSNRESEGLARQIEDHRPDIVLAVETDRWWCDRLDKMTEDLPYKVRHPLDNTYGMFLASRLELIDPELRFLMKDGIPSIRTTVRLPSDDMFVLYALHPEPPSPTEANTALPRDAELVTVAKEIADHDQDTVVAGDLNDVAWSHTSRLFRRLGGMLDARIGRGLFSTFHANYWPLRWPLDHVFASDNFVLHEIERLDRYGSDHFPILTSLSVAPKEARSQSAPAAKGDDPARAEDKLRRSES